MKGDRHAVGDHAPLQQLEMGRIRALVDGGDLRYVEIDGVEVIRRIYITVRDADWDIPPLISVRRQVQTTADAIVITAEAEQHSDTAAVTWRAVARLAADGDLSYSVDISPSSEFSFNRMGLCLLHPPERCAGRVYRALSDGAVKAGILPLMISPQIISGTQILALFPAFNELEIDVRNLGVCHFAFEGDLFEMEDQRNWSDGSFKTYCTPLSQSRPTRASPASPIRQAIRISAPARRSEHQRPLHAVVEVGVGLPRGGSVPDLGLGLGEPLDVHTGQAIRELAPEHLRAELRRPDRFVSVLSQARRDADLAECPVALAVHLGDDPDEELGLLEDLLPAFDLPILRFFVFSRLRPVSSGALVGRARRRLARVCRDAAFIGGTDIWFVDLNRARPSPNTMDGVAWSITPQVHAHDELTMIEGLDAQTAQARTARSFCGDADLFPGPITLRPRYNPNAADAAAQALDYPPFSVDHRQGSHFAASWTAGSIRALALGAVRAATYFETAGPRGIIDGSKSFPCAEVIRWARLRASWKVFETTSSRPLEAAALLVRRPTDHGLEGLLINHTPNVREIRIGPLQAHRMCNLSPDVGASSTPVRDGFATIKIEPFDVLPITVEHA